MFWLIKTRMSSQQLNCMHDIVFSDTLKEGASMFKTTSKTLEKDVSSYYHDYLASLRLLSFTLCLLLTHSFCRSWSWHPHRPKSKRKRKDKLYWCLQCYIIMIIIQGTGLIAAILALVICELIIIVNFYSDNINTIIMQWLLSLQGKTPDDKTLRLLRTHIYM